MEIINTASEEETIQYAQNLAKDLQGGEVFGLIGDLGAGKTVFTKGLAQGLGVKETVTSPTFVLMKIYDVHGHKSIKQLCHIDAYRLKSADEIEAIGALDYLEKDDTVTVIEWPERIKKILPRKTRFYDLRR